MNFRTPVSISPLKNQISYGTPVIMLGSCFTSSIGARMKEMLFDVTVNPFGTIYNPLSVKRSLQALLHKKKYTPEDLQLHQELWFSFDHYTKYADPDPQRCLEKINHDFVIAREKLRQAQFILITFGTAFVYRYRKTGDVVSNCHKIPAAEFDRSMLSPETIVGEYQKLHQELLSINPNLHIIYTVSPVRHLKDGLVENQRSKSILLLAIRELTAIFPETSSYFPSFEIMMDDLRDYRFYESDLIHPNEQAIAYIWEKFIMAAVTPESIKIMKEIEPLQKAFRHRPLHIDTEAYRKFSLQLVQKKKNIKNKYPSLLWDNFQ